MLFRDAQGRPIRSSGSVIDINDLKRAEEKLRESEERFRGTFENAAVGIAHMDSQNRCLCANEKLCEILGFPSSELVGKTLQEVVHPDDLEPNLALFDLLVRGELPSFSMEKRFIRRDGAVVWTHVTASIQRNATTTPAYCIAIVQDISERKRLQEELQRSKTRLELAVRGSNVRIWDIEMPDGNIDNARVYVASPAATFSSFQPTFRLPWLYTPTIWRGSGALLRPPCLGKRTGSRSSSACRPNTVFTAGCFSRGRVVFDAEGKPVRYRVAPSTSQTSSGPRRRCGQREEVPDVRGSCFRRVLPAGDGGTHPGRESSGVPEPGLHAGRAGRDNPVPLRPRPHPRRCSRTSSGGSMPESRSRSSHSTPSQGWDHLPGGDQGQSLLGGRPPLHGGSARDVTDRKRAEEALRLSEQRYRSLVEATSAIVWTLPASGLADKSEQPSWSCVHGPDARTSSPAGTGSTRYTRMIELTPSSSGPRPSPLDPFTRSSTESVGTTANTGTC